MVGTDYYKKQLEKINGISFTPREIDIVSFIINGRTAKKIASTLKLSSKTVENYTRNIMVKVGCNSQEGIRDFIERSGDFSFLRDHYKYILLDINFDEWIKNVKPLISSLQITCLLIYENEKINISLLKNIERHLNLSGFKVLSENKKELKSSNSLFNPLDQMDCKIYCLPSNISLSLNITEVLDYIEKFNIHINCIISLQTTYNIASSISTEFKQDCYINFGEDDYYKQFFVLLQKLTPNLSLGKLISDFEKKEVFSITTNEENQKINKILPIASTVLFDHAESFTKLKRFLNKYSINLEIASN